MSNYNSLTLDNIVDAFQAAGHTLARWQASGRYVGVSSRGLEGAYYDIEFRGAVPTYIGHVPGYGQPDVKIPITDRTRLVDAILDADRAKRESRALDVWRRNNGENPVWD